MADHKIEYSSSSSFRHTLVGEHYKATISGSAGSDVRAGDFAAEVTWAIETNRQRLLGENRPPENTTLLFGRAPSGLSEQELVRRVTRVLEEMEKNHERFVWFLTTKELSDG